jgi:hypothetical protein
MTCNIFSCHIKIATIGLLPLTWLGTIAPAPAAVTQTCKIIPTEGKPNPLAMRANFTMEEQDGTIVTVKYNPAPSLFDSAKPPVMVGSLQSLQFFETNMAAVRARMLQEPKYFKFLINAPEGEGGSFKAFNDALVCQGTTPVAPPAKPPVTPPAAPATPPVTTSAIDRLPDGDYRFWTGAPATNVTDQQIVAAGEGSGLFLFRKTGNKVVGQYARPSDVAYCVAGTIANGKVTGTASPVDRAVPGGRPADNSNYGPVGQLKFGVWKGGDKTGFSEGSMLDLTPFNRINLGARKALTVCR